MAITQLTALPQVQIPQGLAQMRPMESLDMRTIASMMESQQRMEATKYNQAIQGNAAVNDAFDKILKFTPINEPQAQYYNDLKAKYNLNDEALIQATSNPRALTEVSNGLRGMSSELAPLRHKNAYLTATTAAIDWKAVGPNAKYLMSDYQEVINGNKSPYEFIPSEYTYIDYTGALADLAPKFTTSQVVVDETSSPGVIQSYEVKRLRPEAQGLIEQFLEGRPEVRTQMMRDGRLNPDGSINEDAMQDIMATVHLFSGEGSQSNYKVTGDINFAAKNALAQQKVDIQKDKENRLAGGIGSAKAASDQARYASMILSEHPEYTPTQVLQAVYAATHGKELKDAYDLTFTTPEGKKVTTEFKAANINNQLPSMELKYINPTTGVIINIYANSSEIQGYEYVLKDDPKMKYTQKQGDDMEKNLPSEVDDKGNPTGVKIWVTTSAGRARTKEDFDLVPIYNKIAVAPKKALVYNGEIVGYKGDYYTNKDTGFEKIPKRKLANAGNNPSKYQANIEAGLEVYDATDKTVFQIPNMYMWNPGVPDSVKGAIMGTDNAAKGATKTTQKYKGNVTRDSRVLPYIEEESGRIRNYDITSQTAAKANEYEAQIYRDSLGGNVQIAKEMLRGNEATKDPKNMLNGNTMFNDQQLTTAVTDYQWVWSIWKNDIKQYMKDMNIPIETAPADFKAKVDSHAKTNKFGGDYDEVYTFINNADAANGFTEHMINDVYSQNINTIRSKYRQATKYTDAQLIDLIHYQGFGGAQDFLRNPNATGYLDQRRRLTKIGNNSTHNFATLLSPDVEEAAQGPVAQGAPVQGTPVTQGTPVRGTPVQSTPVHNPTPVPGTTQAPRPIGARVAMPQQDAIRINGITTEYNKPLPALLSINKSQFASGSISYDDGKGKVPYDHMEIRSNIVNGKVTYKVTFTKNMYDSSGAYTGIKRVELPHELEWADLQELQSELKGSAISGYAAQSSTSKTKATPTAKGK